MKLFYIDPQSYNNLADYDKYLLSNINAEKYFFCSEKFDHQFDDNTRIDKCFFYNSLKGLKKIFSYINSLLYIVKNTKKYQPDIVHFQWFKIPLIDYMFLKIIKMLSKKTYIVFTAHNILPHNTGEKYKKNYKKIYKYVDGIIVHGNQTKNELIEIFDVDKEKIATIPHGFLPRKKISKKIEQESGSLAFSLIGSLSQYKGVDLLVDAWCSSPMLSSNNSCRLIIAGSGKMSCLTKVEDCPNVKLINRFVSDEELDEIICQTDVAILPYRMISQSGVLLTMLAEKIPVIVSQVGELVQPFEVACCGWIMPSLDVASLRVLLEQIVTNKTVVATIKNDIVSWKKIEKFYSWQEIGKTTTAFYASLCEKY